MKALVMSLIAVASIAAQAEVKRPGTVMPSRCASKIQELGPISMVHAAIRDVCEASVVGDEKNSYLTINEQVWVVLSARGFNTKIQRVGSIGPRGQFQEDLNTAIITGIVVRDQSAKKMQINIGDRKILAEDFQFVITTQGL